MSKRFLSSVLLVACCSGVGCTTIGTGLQTKTPPVAVGTYSVQVIGGMFGTKTKNYPVHENLTAQTVLEETGQLSRHRNFEIDILRKSDSGAGVVKMPVQFDPSKHRVKFESDYAIHPGDHVVIRPVSHSPFEQVAQMLGPSK